MYVCWEALNVIFLRVKLTGITRDKIMFIFCHTNPSRWTQYHFVRWIQICC